MDRKSARGLDDYRLCCLKRKWESVDVADFSGLVQPSVMADYEPSSQACTCSGYGLHSSRVVKENCTKCVESNFPKSLCFYEDGEWKTHPREILGLIKKDLQAKQAIVEVVFCGSRMLLDFGRMVQKDVLTGLEKPLAWYDDRSSEFCLAFSQDHFKSHGDLQFSERNHEFHQCFEPEGTNEMNVGLNLHSSSAQSSTLEEVETRSIKKVKLEENPNVLESLPVGCPETEEMVGENDPCTSLLPPECCAFDHFHGKLAKLLKGENAYNTVVKLLLLGIECIILKEIVGIYNIPPGSPFGQARLKLFKKHAEDATRLRGNANIRYAWFSSSKEGAEQVMFWGLANARRPVFKPMYGNGIHLNPANCSRLSTKGCAVDGNGLVHLVLCRVILGNMEKINPGSKQSESTSRFYDSGVDSFENPNHYIIWEHNADSHILPEYVVSFRITTKVQDHLLPSGRMSDSFSLTCGDTTGNSLDARFSVPGLNVDSEEVTTPPLHSMENAQFRRNLKVPTSPWMPFSMLFAAISTKVTKQDMEQVNVHYDEYKRKQISRVDLIKKLRIIIGDKLLISTILHLQHKVPPPRHH